MRWSCAALFALTCAACHEAPPNDELRALREGQERILAKLEALSTQCAHPTATDARTATADRPDKADDTVRLGRAPTRGAKTPVVAVTEFADFECPRSALAAAVSQELIAAYPDTVEFTFRHFPVLAHPHARDAAKAAWAAHQQGKFWEMHDLLFAHQAALTGPDLTEYARRLGLDLARFATDLAGFPAEATIVADKQFGQWSGLTSTPAFLVDGTLIAEADVAGVKARVAQALAAKQASGGDTNRPTSP